MHKTLERTSRRRPTQQETSPETIGTARRGSVERTRVITVGGYYVRKLGREPAARKRHQTTHRDRGHCASNGDERDPRRKNPGPLGPTTNERNARLEPGTEGSPVPGLRRTIAKTGGELEDCQALKAENPHGTRSTDSLRNLRNHKRSSRLKISR